LRSSNPQNLFISLFTTPVASRKRRLKPADCTKIKHLKTHFAADLAGLNKFGIDMPAKRADERMKKDVERLDSRFLGMVPAGGKPEQFNRPGC
jgi:hypothetical protein